MGYTHPQDLLNGLPGSLTHWTVESSVHHARLMAGVRRSRVSYDATVHRHASRQAVSLRLVAVVNHLRTDLGLRERESVLCFCC